MKRYLGFCLLILWAASIEGAERQPEFPGSTDNLSSLLEKRLALAGVETSCISKSASTVDSQETVFEFAGYSGAAEARIEYLMSYVTENDWALKSPSEIRLYPQPENSHPFWGCGCILFNR